MAPRPAAMQRWSDYYSSDYSFRICDTAELHLPYKLSRPVEQSAGLYCMIITFKGFVPPGSISACYDSLSNKGGDHLWMGVSESVHASPPYLPPSHSYIQYYYTGIWI